MLLLHVSLHFILYIFHLVIGNFDSTCINGGKFTESNLEITCMLYVLIVGFHMTSLKFKLQNYPSYRDVTFTMY